MKRGITYLLLLLLVSSCSENSHTPSNNSGDPLFQDPELAEINPDGYIINPFTKDSVRDVISAVSDSFVSGKYIDIEWDVVAMDTMYPAEVVAANGMNSHFLGSKSTEIIVDTISTEFDLDQCVPRLPFKERTLIDNVGDTVKGNSPIIIDPIVRDYHPSKPQMAEPFLKRDESILNLQYLDANQGLSCSYVFDTHMDSIGNLWLATSGGGLCRFDGNQFEYHNQKSGFVSDYCVDILPTKTGELWVGAYGDGLGRFDGEKYMIYNLGNGFSANRIPEMDFDSKGNIWAATEEFGILKIEILEEAKIRVTFYSAEEGLTSCVTTSVAVDSKDRVWVATRSGVCVKVGPEFYDLESYGIVPELIETVFVDSKDRIWIGSRSGRVFLIDNQNLLECRLVGDKEWGQLSIISEDHDGNIWLGTAGAGAWQFSFRNSSPSIASEFTVEDGLNGDFVQGIYEDRAGNIWFSLDGGGITKYKKNSFANYSIQNGLHDDFINDIYEDSEGNMWFAGWSNGVARVDKNLVFTHYTTESGLSFDGVWCFAEDDKGGLWMGTFGGGLSHFRDETFTHYTQWQGLPSDGVFSTVLDKEGLLWYGTWGGGAGKFDGERFYNLNTANGLGSNKVRFILETKDGSIWMATDEGGLSCVMGNKLINYTEREGLAANEILSLEEDHDGNIWIGTNGYGLTLFDGHKLQNYTTSQGLIDNVIWGLTTDPKGNLWVSTNRGLSLLTKEEGKSFFDSKVMITSFGNKDGIKGLDYYANSEFIDSKNLIWWGSGKGVTNLNLNHFSIADAPPNVTLSHIEIMEKFIDFRSSDYTEEFDISGIDPYCNYPNTMTLPYNKNHLTFHFSGIDWYAPHKIKYSYQMEGIEDDWSLPSSDPKADFRSLPHGDYNFKLRAIGESGEWSETFEFAFTILPPWWHSWWARVLYVLGGLFIIYTFVRIRTRQLKVRQLELETEVEAATVELRVKNEELGFKNELIANQKQRVEEAHKEITDSIAYAKRIQSAILPPSRLVSELLPNAFIIYKPKDVVAGDFYWLESKGEEIFFAAADCTGHGVPGAMVSVICNGALNRAVREFNLEDPGQILDKAREIVIKEFEKSDEEMKDGMDIALCRIKGQKLAYAGAHNPLWIVRNGEVLEIKANKQPIGKFDVLSPYTTHHVDLLPGDRIYIFSDGYVDQFGGEKGKKFKAKNLKQLLISLQDSDLNEQKVQIEKAFDNWKGKLEQVDDVCVIGLGV